MPQIIGFDADNTGNKVPFWLVKEAHFDIFRGTVAISLVGFNSQGDALVGRNPVQGYTHTIWLTTENSQTFAQSAAQTLDILERATTALLSTPNSTDPMAGAVYVPLSELTFIPKPVSGITAAEAPAGTLVSSWIAPTVDFLHSPATGYTIELGSSVTGPFGTPISVTLPTQSFTALSTGLYYLRVVAMNATGTSRPVITGPFSVA